MARSATAEDILSWLTEELDSEDHTEITELVDKATDIDLILMPLSDGNDSDRDDAPSDDESTAAFMSLGKGVLRERAEIRLVTKSKEFSTSQKCDLLPYEDNRLETPLDNEEAHTCEIIPRPPISEIPLKPQNIISIENEQNKLRPTKFPNRKRKRNDPVSYHWESKLLKAESTNQSKTCLEKYLSIPNFCSEIQKNNLNPVDLFRIVFNDDIMEHICKESVKYAVSKGFHSFQLSVEEIYIYFGILILSGYNKLPCRRMFWETKSDVYNHLVAKSMTRNRFEEIHRFLHFNDNDCIDQTDKMYKVRPIITHLNDKFKTLLQPLGSAFSLDEAMEPYYGHNPMKQYIRGKPIRYGYKIWCLASPEGYVVQFSPYTGKGDCSQGKTLGASVTEKLCLNFVPPKSIVFVDNYFNSMPLLETMTKNDIYIIGTIREDRISKAPLKNLKKEARGSYHVLQDKDKMITLVKWQDNSQVTMATNMTDDNIVLSHGSCSRYSSKDKKRISVVQPTVVKYYNRGMGGVDLFDQHRGTYRIRIRSRKWYWPIFRFCLNGSVVNIWLLYRKLYKTMPLLDFTRRITLALLAAPDIERPREVRPKKISQGLKECRYDELNHLVDKESTQRRCGSCGKCTKFRCVKCNIGLHPESCFVKYHTK